MNAILGWLEHAHQRLWRKRRRAGDRDHPAQRPDAGEADRNDLLEMNKLSSGEVRLEL